MRDSTNVAFVQKAVRSILSSAQRGELFGAIPVKFPQANLWLPAPVWETTSFTTQTHDLKLNRVSRANLNMTCRPSLADLVQLGDAVFTPREAASALIFSR
jgi:hypothetical protein